LWVCDDIEDDPRSLWSHAFRFGRFVQKQLLVQADRKRLTSLGDEGLYLWAKMLQLRAASATHLLLMESKLRKTKAKVVSDNFYGQATSAYEEVKKLTSRYLRVVNQRDEAQQKLAELGKRNKELEAKLDASRQEVSHLKACTMRETLL